MSKSPFELKLRVARSSRNHGCSICASTKNRIYDYRKYIEPLLDGLSQEDREDESFVNAMKFVCSGKVVHSVKRTDNMAAASIKTSDDRILSDALTKRIPFDIPGLKNFLDEISPTERQELYEYLYKVHGHRIYK